MNDFLHADAGPAGWKFGWKSHEKSTTASFWHRHFAGFVSFSETPYNCESQLAGFPIIHSLWRKLATNLLQGHRLIRCYANGHTYGNEGTLHTDTDDPYNYTSIYYPHSEWFPNWAGETVFFNQEKTDILAAVYPRPNRLLVFDGSIPHIARGVSRNCPMLRITLMFKTDIPQ